MGTSGVMNPSPTIVTGWGSPEEVGSRRAAPRLTWKSCGLLERGFLGELFLLFTPTPWCTEGLRGSKGGSDPGGPEEEEGSVSSPVATWSSVSSSPAVSAWARKKMEDASKV